VNLHTTGLSPVVFFIFILYIRIMAKAKKTKKKDTSINLPKEDIKVEPGQLTFLPALKKVIKKKPSK